MERKNKINKILDSKTPVIIIESLVFAFIIYSAVIREYNLNKFEKFTIGKATGTSNSGSRLYLDYVYYIDANRYNSSQYLGDECGNCKIGKYFRVKYSYKKPGFSELYFNREVTDTTAIKTAGFKLE